MERALEQLLVVRRDADVAPAVEQRVEAADEAARTCRRPGRRSPPARRRCPCRAARSGAAARGRRCRQRALEIRLEHDPDVVAPAARGARGRARACRRCSSSPPCRCGRTCLGAAASSTSSPSSARQRSRSSLRPSAGQLDADVRVEPVAVDRREHIVIGVGDRLRLVRPRHFLAETSTVASFPSAFSAATVRRASSSVAPGDVRRGEPLHDRPRDRGQQVDDRAVEEAHRARDSTSAGRDAAALPRA